MCIKANKFIRQQRRKNIYVAVDYYQPNFASAACVCVWL